jgi:hypothetical protein
MHLLLTCHLESFLPGPCFFCLRSPAAKSGFDLCRSDQLLHAISSLSAGQGPVLYFCVRRVFLPRSVCLRLAICFQFSLSTNDFDLLDCLRQKRTTRSSTSVYSAAAQSSSATHEQLLFLLCSQFPDHCS